MVEGCLSYQTHFSFSEENKSNVKFYYLSDIFELGNAQFSVGDIMITIPFIGILIADFIQISLLISSRRKKKQKFIKLIYSIL